MSSVSILASQILYEDAVSVLRKNAFISESIDGTPLYISGSGSIKMPVSTSENQYYVKELTLCGTMTYLKNGSVSTIHASIVLPIYKFMTSLNAKTPELSVYYDFFADNIRKKNECYITEVDGKLQFYLTDTIPISIQHPNELFIQ